MSDRTIHGPILRAFGRGGAGRSDFPKAVMVSSSAADGQTASRGTAIAYLNPIRATRHLRQHQELIGQLVRREITQRYKGSTLGIAWPFLQPLFLLGVYTFVFAGIFKAQWPGVPGEGTASFALVLFTGLITFSIFSECVTSAPRLILSHPNFVKRVVFPLEVLPLVKVIAALTQGALSLCVLLAGLFLFGMYPTWTALLVPLAWLPLALFALGLCFFLSSMGVFLRDLEQLVGVVVTVLFFGSAIFFPLAQVPEPARHLIEWVPTAVFIEDTRRLLLFDHASLRLQSVVTAGVAFATAMLGFAWFMKSKKAFADVI